jgi:predicted lipid-binding transport protein (Tim44 family)
MFGWRFDINWKEFRGGFIGGLSVGLGLSILSLFISPFGSSITICIPLALIVWVLPSYWVSTKLKTKSEKFGFLAGLYIIILFALASLYYLISNPPM